MPARAPMPDADNTERARRTPKAWRKRDFDRWILDCAIRDREAMVIACGDDDSDSYVIETKAELSAMYARRAALKNA